MKKLEIKFIEQKRFSKCKNKRTLPFDFYLPEHNTCIEYDGIQHYNSKWIGEESLTKIKNNDNIKNRFCGENKINLIRIPYTKKNKIGDILNENNKEGFKRRV